ncbi:sorting nexin-6-like [Convolutriloba macropyga]|uniref:sorting nexin-6-like n=1 Tax=Convolutriloba macropyga TaxID=536237 RepID=UPI003F522965
MSVGSEDDGGGLDFLGGDRKNPQEESNGSAVHDQSSSPSNLLSSSSTTQNGQTGLIAVDISDAVSESNKVKFTIHTKTSHPSFAKKEISVQREHEEFVWLHDTLKSQGQYAGYIIPPAPPRPNFDASREKLQKLSEGENVMTKEEFTKMKQELEAEYLATFKKTVAMHEMFLQRLAKHSIFQNDHSFQVFLEYEQDLMVRVRSKKDVLEGFIKGMSKSIDEIILAGQKDVDAFYEEQKTSLVEYSRRVNIAARHAEMVVCSIRRASNLLLKVSIVFGDLATQEGPEINKFHQMLAELFEKLRKLEARVSSDTDLKLADLLKYTSAETAAGTELMYRRTKALADYESANKSLDRARLKPIPQDKSQTLEAQQEAACEKYEKITELGRSELKDVQQRKVTAFGKYLVEYSELMVKHSKVSQRR